MVREITLKDIASMVGGKVVGNPSIVITSVADVEKSAASTISPFWEKKFSEKITAGMNLLSKEGWIPEGCSGVETEDPRRALVDILNFFDTRTQEEPAVHPSAVISPLASVGENVHIGPGCVVSDGAHIGDNALLLGNVWIGRCVSVGSNTRIEQGVVLYDSASIGKNCIIHANAVIGCDGFGFMPDPKCGLLRIPQIGTVTIEDNVEIGACSCIDRATFGDTHISYGTKIDAQVKIGHNSHLGKFCIVVSQVGIAGSSTLGNGVVMAAQSGIANHASIGDGATVGGRGGVVTDVPAGATVSGFPAQDHNQELRRMTAMKHLPDIIKSVRELKQKIEELAEKCKQHENTKERN